MSDKLEARGKFHAKHVHSLLVDEPLLQKTRGHLSLLSEQMDGVETIKHLQSKDFNAENFIATERREAKRKEQHKKGEKQEEVQGRQQKNFRKTRKNNSRKTWKMHCKNRPLKIGQ